MRAEKSEMGRLEFVMRAAQTADCTQGTPLTLPTPETAGSGQSTQTHQ